PYFTPFHPTHTPCHPTSPQACDIAYPTSPQIFSLSPRLRGGFLLFPLPSRSWLTTHLPMADRSQNPKNTKRNGFPLRPISNLRCFSNRPTLCHFLNDGPEVKLL